VGGGGGAAAAVIEVGVEGADSLVENIRVGEESRLELYTMDLPPRPLALMGRARSGVVGTDILRHVERGCAGNGSERRMGTGSCE
jgi:hypothetical protein